MDNLALGQGGNLALASGALATGTTTSAIKTTATIPFIIDGRYYSKSATDNISIAYTADSAVYSATAGGVSTGNGAFTGGSNGSTRLYNLYMDTSGNVTVQPGPIVDSVALSSGFAPLQFAAPKKGKVCFGALRIALTSGTTFIPGTTLLGASGVTATYYNLASVPAEPLLS